MTASLQQQLREIADEVAIESQQRRTEVAKLRTALMKYAKHTPECKIFDPHNFSCTCGRDSTVWELCTEHVKD